MVEEKRDDTIKLGDMSGDKVSGFAGVVVCISEWFTGSRRFTLAPTCTKDGKLMQNETFDEEQLFKIESVPQQHWSNAGDSGDQPTRNADPTEVG